MDFINFMITCGIVIVAMFTFLIIVTLFFILIILLVAFVKWAKTLFNKDKKN